MNELPQIVGVAPLDDHKLRIEFADGVLGVHDLSWALQRSTPMNEPLRDINFFRRVFVDQGALAWPNGFDLSPWNIRKRMEDAGELARVPTPRTEKDQERKDLQRVQAWMEARNIDAKRLATKRSSSKTPDFQLLRGGDVVGLCEVKSRQAASWRAIYENEPFYEIGNQGKDPTFNSLSKYVLASHEQLLAADPSHAKCWVVAIVNHDYRVDVFDFRETLTGDFFATDGKRYATMRGVSEGALKTVKFDIDLYLWFETDEVFTIVGEADHGRAERTKGLFALNGPRVLWSV